MSEISTFIETWDTLLKHFCSRDDLRLAMCKPNIVGNHIYATDAHSWIKIPFQPSFRDYGTHPKTPNFAAVSAKWKFIEPISISKQSILTALSRFDKKPDWCACKECNGNGSKECECCGTDSDCINCDGTGAIDDYTVPEVYDNGRYNEGAIVILENIVAPFQLGRLVRVIDFLRVDRIDLVTNQKAKALIFKSGDTEICVMPLNRDDYEYKKSVKLEI